MKNLLKDRYKVALYTGDNKEVKLNEDGLFEEDVDVIISTSSIQNGQSIKENIMSIFVQTYIDTVSSVKQFLGRNRNRNSDVYLYVRYGKHLNKRKYSIPNNRYERYLNRLRNEAWNETNKYMLDDILYKYGRIRFGKTDDDDTMYYALYESDECISDDDISDESTDDESTDDNIVNEPTTNESTTDNIVNEPIA